MMAAILLIGAASLAACTIVYSMCVASAMREKAELDAHGLDLLAQWLASDIESDLAAHSAEQSESISTSLILLEQINEAFHYGDEQKENEDDII